MGDNGHCLRNGRNAVKRIVVDSPERVGLFVAKKNAMQGNFANFSAIGLEEDGELIAGVVFNDFNEVSICMHVAATEGKRWMTREYLWLCFHYPFEQLKVRRITGVVEEGNHAARKFDEHLGFVLEASLKDAGKTGDLLVYRMFKEDCRFLRIMK
jgi:RimJ/RimL family protein N-acetyltransferase